MNTIRLASLLRIAPVSLALEYCIGWHPSIASSTLLRLQQYRWLGVWVPMGHNAVELCAGPTCHQGALAVAVIVQPGAKAAFINVVSSHGEPCIDRAVMHEQLQAPEAGPPIAARVIFTVPAPLVVEQTSLVRANRCMLGKLCWPYRARSGESLNSPPLPPHFFVAGTSRKAPARGIRRGSALAKGYRPNARNRSVICYTPRTPEHDRRWCGLGNSQGVRVP